LSSDIHKAAGIIIRNRKLLVEKSKNKRFFIAPGGSIEDGETAKQALVRELKEEFKIDVLEDDLEEFGEFTGPAAGQEDRTLYMTAFMVKKWAGEPVADNEVEQIAWVNSQNEQNLPVGSIFEHHVMPKLKERGLID
jgi:mutator protein MutT